MKKKVSAGIVGVMLVSGVALAAPVVNLEKGQTSIGYNYSSLETEILGISIDDSKTNGYYVETAVTDKVILGIDYNKASLESGNNHADLKITDIYAKYKVGANANVLIGNRQYDFEGEKENKITYGIEETTRLDDNLNGYGSVKHNSYETEWQFGVTYALNNATNLDINYKRHSGDYDVIFKGFGIGINYKF